MLQSDRFLRISQRFSFLAPARQGLLLSIPTLLLAGSLCMAQDPPSDLGPGAPFPQATGKEELILPAGTRIALALTHPIQSRYVHRGDNIYAQITAPVTSGSHVLIPPGTFVQGKMDKITQTGGQAELHLQSASLTFPNGYVASIFVPLTLESDEGYALRDPGKARLIGAFVLPAAGAGLGAAIGHFAGGNGTNINGMMFNPSGLRDTAIGSMGGLAVGGIGSLALLLSTRNFYLLAGAPLELVLEQPLSLGRVRIHAPVRQ